MTLAEFEDTFQSVDEETRLELLLDYSRKLPPLPERLHEARDAGLHSVPECMSPVFLLIECEDGRLHPYIDVAPEAPTVRGLVAIVREIIDREPPSVAANLPDDLLARLGLARQIRMQRALGIGAVIGRIKRAAREAECG